MGITGVHYEIVVDVKCDAPGCDQESIVVSDVYTRNATIDDAFNEFSDWVRVVLPDGQEKVYCSDHAELARGAKGSA